MWRLERRDSKERGIESNKDKQAVGMGQSTSEVVASLGAGMAVARP